jgi:hypothetical protein
MVYRVEGPKPALAENSRVTRNRQPNLVPARTGIPANLVLLSVYSFGEYPEVGILPEFLFKLKSLKRG